MGVLIACHPRVGCVSRAECRRVVLARFGAAVREELTLEAVPDAG